jgi:transposase
LLRKRKRLVEQQSANVVSIQNIFLRNTGTRLSTDRINRLSAADL